MTPKETIVDKVQTMFAEMESDINLRNAEINKRYNAIYSTGLFELTNIKSGFDRTDYNLLPRVVDIHTMQLFGRDFQFWSGYAKEDLSVYDQPTGDDQQDQQNKQEKQMAKMRNARKAVDADTRMQAVRDIIRDNGDYALFTRAGRIGTWAGFSVFKGWLDKSKKRYNISLIESPQNFWSYWSNSNFRESDFDCYMYQISLSKAERLYGDKLGEGEKFEVSAPGGAWQRATGEKALDLQRLARKMVWVVDGTGYVPGYATKDGEIIEVSKASDETEMSLLIVGNKVVQVLSENLPKYYNIPNEELAMSPWGQSTISEQAIQIMATMLETASDWKTASQKYGFPKMKFIGFTDFNMPAPADRSAEGFPMDSDQDIAPINLNIQALEAFPRLMQYLMDMFVKATKVSRVMLDDPTINPASNQALMTTMKPLIDVTEDKQKRWKVGLVDMFIDALEASAELDPALKEATSYDDSWKTKVDIEWPSVLRVEDQSYQQMYINRWNAGTISPESYLQAMGVKNVSEEIDRMRDAMEDPLRAAMLGRGLAEMAHFALNKSLGIPPWGYITPKVQLRGELPPNNVGNMGHNYGWDQGPYGGGMGPTGYQGAQAIDDWYNQGLLDDNGQPQADPGIMPRIAQPGGQNAAPALTPDQNTGTQPVSQPGSGAPAVSAQGAIAQQAQQQGR